MECRRDELTTIDPDTGRVRIECPCPDCAEEQHERDVLEASESSLRRVIGACLRVGMMPDEIVAAVRSRTRKRSRATMLTRVELTCQAGSWLSRPDLFDHLDQVDELCKYTGFRVGGTIPGWLHRWFDRKGNGDLRAVTNGVLDVWLALADELDDTVDRFASLRPAEPERPAGGTSPELVRRRSGEVIYPTKWW